MYDDDKFIKYTLLLALAYFGGHVLYYIGLELSCYLYGVLHTRVSLMQWLNNGECYEKII